MHRKVTAIILAGGKGSRMHSETPKQYLPLLGKPVLFYSIQAFEQSDVDEIVLVCASGEEEYCKNEIVEKYGFRKVTAVVEGGKERYNSVYCGINAAATADYVLIHDGARPLIGVDIINSAIKYTREINSCVVGVPEKDTIWKIDTTEGKPTLKENPPRSMLWIAQTPQCFPREIIQKAYCRAIEEKATDLTDDAMVARRYGRIQVDFIEGSYQNIKITTPEDITIAEAFLKLH